MERKSIGIVGATGLVGRKMIEVIEEYGLLFNKVKLFASKKKIGITLETGIAFIC